MARGGARAGTPGKAYPNRTDMHQPIRAPSGGEYGSVKASIDAQKVIPLPTANNAPVQQGQAAQPGPVIAPGSMDFEAPSQRPSEPVTAGLPDSAGPGPEALNLPTNASNVAMQLRTMYANIPAAQNADMLRLVELAEQQAWQ